VKRTLTTIIACLALSSCWPWWSSDPGTDWCACDYGDTTCSGYDWLGSCEDDCSFTYHDCTALCRDAGFGRSAGCGYDSSSGGYACLCTDDTECDCIAEEATCWDFDTLLTCDDGCFWSAYDCDDLCRASGWDTSTGCAHDFAAGEDTCFCEDYEDCVCSAGEVECDGAFGLASCDDGCYWYSYDCDALCEDAGYEYSTGCGWDSSAGEDTCFCESSSDCDCSWGEVECWDHDSIASCDDDCYWYVYDCDALCMDAGYDYTTGCAYDWDAGEDTCFCESY